MSFEKRSIRGDLFVIVVEKINLYYDEYLHFTLVVTASDLPIRLDPTATHYEKYQPNAQKKFLLEYDPTNTNALNLYTEGLEKMHAAMTLTVRDAKLAEGEGEGEGRSVLRRKLVRDYEMVDLDAELEELDIC